MRKFVCGDIHGAYKALKQVLEKSKFDYQEDMIIFLGDVADGWPEVPECFDEILKIKNFLYVMGNHDKWLLDWFIYGSSPPIWTAQGGRATIDAYIRRYKDEGTGFAKKHQELLESKATYHVEYDNKLFIHGGYDWHKPVTDTPPYERMWDRHLFGIACMWEQYNERGVEGKELRIVKDYDEVFVGHTSTCYTHKDMLPVHVSNVWNLDQGAGWEGKLTLMDIDTKEFWQSDIVKTLYPNERGRF